MPPRIFPFDVISGTPNHLNRILLLSAVRFRVPLALSNRRATTYSCIKIVPKELDAPTDCFQGAGKRLSNLYSGKSRMF
jgi:hypothetical protein